MVNSKKLKTIKTNQKPFKTMKVPWKIMKTKQKLWQTKTSKNIVNDYEVQKIASVAMVTCVQENRYHQALKKKTIAIALPPKFDDRSSLVGTRMLMMTITHNHHFHWCQESRILLTAYALFITLMFGLQIAAIVLTVLYKVTTIYIHTTLSPHQDCYHHHHVKADPGQLQATSDQDRYHHDHVNYCTTLAGPSIIIIMSKLTTGRARRTSTLATCSSPRSPRTPRRRRGMRWVIMITAMIMLNKCWCWWLSWLQCNG